MKKLLKSISQAFVFASIAIVLSLFLFLSGFLSHPIEAQGYSNLKVNNAVAQSSFQDRSMLNRGLAADTSTKKPTATEAATSGGASTEVTKELAKDSNNSVPKDGSGGFIICGNQVDNPCNIRHLFAAAIIIINYLIGMAGFVAVFFIVYAGVLMIASQGQGNLTKAKGRLAGAVIGLFIIASAFVLVNTLFSGSLSLGIKDGGKIFSDPRGYINQTK